MPQSLDWNGHLESPPTREGIKLRKMHDGRFPLAAILLGDYELEAEFTREEGSDDVGLIFPLGNQFSKLHFGVIGGTVAGISHIDGKGCENNSTTRRPSPLVTQQRHKIRLTTARQARPAMS